MAMHTMMMSFRHDPDAVRGRKLERDLLRRVMGLAQPYRKHLIGFLISVIAAAGVAVLPPLLFRALLDDAVPNSNTQLVTLLALGAVGLAIAGAGLSLLQRWYSAHIGESMIYDLRISMFDHVQRLPISFFTRAQTGSLMSRMNNDVIGAQQAVTGTLGTVVSNTITIIITLAVMFSLEWRLTLMTLIVLPAFIIPARRIGRKLQVATREGMQLNASMNNTAAERFNVSGALVVKLFGNHDLETELFSNRARRV
ncbi:MAG: ABC transporter ATP-binding protein, partial [Actinobacteria bacterium]|nr:ABC transporter ATP-binding protein [Actinomycetota bacterium]